MLAPVKIDDRIDAHLGTPPGGGRRPVIIHLHERYGIVQHTMDLGEKFVTAGYVTIVPDLFSRFTGDRDQLARGETRADLSDDEVLEDIDAVVDYVKGLPEADSDRIAMSGVCQTGRQPVLIGADRDYLSAAVVLYGAVYNDDWASHALRPEPIQTLLKRISCPVIGIFGELDNLVPIPNVLRMLSVLAETRKSFDVRIYPDAPHGFLNDTMPGRYRAAQTEAAWNQITSCLQSIFAGEWKRDRAIWRFQSDSSLDYDFTKNKRWE